MLVLRDFLRALLKLGRELLLTLRHPQRLRWVFDSEVLSAWWRSLVQRDGSWRLVAKDQPWSPHSRHGFEKKEFASYDHYVRLQTEKLGVFNLREYDQLFRRVLRERLLEHPHIRPGMSVLCVAARIGTEVKAFGDAGLFAVGIDLNPGKDNPYVLPGDFHELQFADHSVDVVFTNSLDHVLDIDRVLKEIDRVLKPRGLLLTEVMRGTDEEQGGFGDYETFRWKTVDDLIALIEARSFVLEYRSPFEEPWVGDHLCFVCGNS